MTVRSPAWFRWFSSKDVGAGHVGFPTDTGQMKRRHEAKDRREKAVGRAEL